MLQNMRHPRIIRCRRTESNIEYLVIVIVGKQAYLRSGLLMFQIITSGIQFCNQVLYKNKKGYLFGHQLQAGKGGEEA